MVYGLDESASKPVQTNHWFDHARCYVVRDFHRLSDFVYLDFLGLCVRDLGREFQTDNAVDDAEHELNYAKRSVDGCSFVRLNGHRDGGRRPDGAFVYIHSNDYGPCAWRVVYRRLDRINHFRRRHGHRGRIGHIAGYYGRRHDEPVRLQRPTSRRHDHRRWNIGHSDPTVDHVDCYGTRA